VTFFDTEPAHLSHADGAHVLERADAGHVIGEGVDEEVDLDAADVGGIVVDQFDGGIDVWHGVGEVALFVGFFEVVLQGADQGHVLVEQGFVAGAELGGDAFEVAMNVIEDADEAFFVFHLAVELGEHLVGVIDGGDGLIGTGVGHAGPGVGAIGHGDAELDGAEAGLGGGVGLQVVFDFLVDGNAAGPACGVAAAAADVAGEEFGAGEQAAHAAHVGVAITTHFVVHAVEDEGAFFEGLEGFEDGFELEGVALLLWPEVLGQGAVWAEHDDHALAPLRGGGTGEAGQAGEEGQAGGGETEVAEELTAGERHD
jgi:hypothetical protein